MKKIILILALFSISLGSMAQYDLLFCTNADSLGNCKGKGETFAWKGDKTYLDLIVMNKDKIGTKTLNFMLFYMANDREGKLYAELDVNIKSDALFAVKKMYFYKPGYYRVEVLDEKRQPLTHSYLTILDTGE